MSYFIKQSRAFVLEFCRYNGKCASFYTRLDTLTLSLSTSSLR
jgi:hypothetical protein